MCCQRSDNIHRAVQKFPSGLQRQAIEFSDSCPSLELDYLKTQYYYNLAKITFSSLPHSTNSLFITLCGIIPPLFFCSGGCRERRRGREGGLSWLYLPSPKSSLLFGRGFARCRPIRDPIIIYGRSHTRKERREIT